MLSIRQLPRWSSRLLASTRAISSSSLRLDGQCIKSRLYAHGFNKFSNAQVIKFLEEQNLKTLAKTVKEDDYYGGERFLVNIWELSQLSQEHLRDTESLASIFKGKLTSPRNFVVRPETFSFEGVVSGIRSTYFHLDRDSTFSLVDKIIESPGFYLIHGPRRSGKSTLCYQMMNAFINMGFVFAKVDFYPNPDSDSAAMWKDVAKGMTKKHCASPEVCEVAKQYLASPNEPDATFLKFLFEQNYGGKKLVLFWDDFHRDCDPQYRNEVFPALRSLSDAMKNPPSTFGGVVCLGTFNSTVVDKIPFSVFTPSNTFGPEVLHFTPLETKELFDKYRKSCTRAKVSDEVVEIIHRETGGHPSLVNACGRFIRDELFGNGDLSKWNNSTDKLVNFVSEPFVSKALLNSVEGDPKLRSLLLRLCHGDWVRKRPSRFEQDCAQHLGFAKVEVREGTDYIVIKSQLIRQFVYRHYLNTPVFEDIPMTSENKLDIPEFISAVVSGFNRYAISGASSMEHMVTGEKVPRESTYRSQFGSQFGSRQFHLPYRKPSWRMDRYATIGEETLDIFLDIPKGKEISATNEPHLQVGIVFTASSNVESLKERCAQSYPQLFSLDQYAIFNFTPIETKEEQETFFAAGIDKHGQKAEIPIVHVVHNKEFSEVKLLFKPTLQSKAVTKHITYFDDDDDE